jgi:hypothetical protein
MNEGNFKTQRLVAYKHALTVAEALTKNPELKARLYEISVLLEVAQYGPIQFGKISPAIPVRFINVNAELSEKEWAFACLLEDQKV